MKRNKLSRLLLVLTVLAMIAALVSCKGNKDQNSDTSADSYVERTEYTITFESNGGSKVPPITVYKNAQLANFEPPVRDDYIFIGWTHEGRAWEFGEGGDYVKSDMTLYANWAKLNSVFKYEEVDGEIEEADETDDDPNPGTGVMLCFGGVIASAVAIIIAKKKAKYN